MLEKAHPMALSTQDVTPLQRSDQSGAIVVAKEENTQNGGLSMADSIGCASRRHEDDLQMLGRIIKEHEDSLKLLKTQKNNLEDSILDKQAFLGKCLSSSQSASESQSLSCFQTEEETMKQITRHEKSAAGLIYHLKTRYSASHITLIKDVLGVVAALGKVNDDNLSKLFSEYLGMATMLAVVCKSYEGVKALETCDGEGSLNRSSGLHGLAASIGRQLDGRFLVICLENLRPYAGEFVPNDPQRRLDLLKPRLPSGELPPGFLGFAVNMINVDAANLFYVTSNGGGLRETLFYNLFSRLQVFKTRTDMMNAIPCLSDGAISLDGGMIRASGVFSLGRREEVDVRFGVGLMASNLPMNYSEMERQMKMMKWKKEKLGEDIRREQALLDQARYNFELKKQEFVKFLAESSAYMNQRQVLTGQR